MVALDADKNIRYIAVSASHVYWYSSSGIFRQAKSGGSPEFVTAGESGGGGCSWTPTCCTVRAPELFSLPIGETTASSLVSDANLPVEWTVRGDRAGGAGASARMAMQRGFHEALARTYWHEIGATGWKARPRPSSQKRGTARHRPVRGES